MNSRAGFFSVLVFVQAAGFQCVLANRANSIIDSPVAELEMTLPPQLQLYGFRRGQHVRVLCALLTPQSVTRFWAVGSRNTCFPFNPYDRYCRGKLTHTQKTTTDALCVPHQNSSTGQTCFTNGIWIWRTERHTHTHTNSHTWSARARHLGPGSSVIGCVTLPFVRVCVCIRAWQNGKHKHGERARAQAHIYIYCWPSATRRR